MRLVRRSFSVGVAFDIDVVLLKGSRVLPGAIRAIQKLLINKIPYVFLKNGGGMLEAAKVKDLSLKTGIPVKGERVILSQTPFCDLAAEYKGKPVLILGHDGCLDIARDYGFTSPVSVRQMHALNPLIYPRPPGDKKLQRPLSPVDPLEIAAAIIFHDPVHWALEMQLLIDLLHTEDGT